ncbi:hypothetical protein OPT61_g1579 [Boeremia exigua]|uniref:Uncharacterized protein n=1 Tax=Boeremia exigua TaxID=749465 RepID=A0ACC2IPS8_9PLEO|nr:hypothetical protein OPT61_g1579 [Boeremia exigua]
MTAQPSVATSAVPACAQYYTHALPAVVEQQQSNKAIFWKWQYSCDALASKYSISVEDLLKWNPSLSSKDCVLQLGVKYCVVQVEESKRATTKASQTASGNPPICTFDPKKGQYVCPEAPPICTFDPKKGEYVCPKPASTGKAS